jgi:hypothetical protein
MAGGATPLGRLRGDLYDPQVHDGILVATSERYLHVVDLAARQDRRHLLPDRDCAASVAWLPEALALTLSCADATRIRLYPRDGLGAAGGVSARQASRSATAPAQRAR